jgi:PleD family two-component response regulator
MLPHEASEHKVVTISLGLAWGVPTPGNDIINYIKAADEALYESKATGRNRLTVRPTS